MNTEDIVARLGGQLRTAKICGVDHRAVARWPQSGIPPWHWAAIVAYAEREHIPGVTYDSIQEARRLAREGAQ